MTDAHLRDAFYLMIGLWLTWVRPNGYEYRSPLSRTLH